ncbi:MAG: hypothetical protein F7B61_06245 [Caldisphaeraceae archaeon]|nr:hypothetical protein [Caldisphaeraceae archaeon]
MALCSVCGKRQAVYHHTYSGKNLCIKCLSNMIERSVKRGINKTKALKYDSRIIIPIVHFSPSSSIVLANMVSRIERKFNTTILVLIPEVYNYNDIYQKLERSNIESIARVKVNASIKGSLSLEECIRLERAWILKIADELGYDVIMLPITRTDISLMLLDLLLNGKKEYLSEVLDIDYIKGIKVLYPFSSIEGEALASYEAISGSYVEPFCNVKMKTKKIFYSVAGFRPELDFGSARIIPSIPNLEFGRCEICGGFSEKKTCELCEKLDLKNMQISIYGDKGPS